MKTLHLLSGDLVVSPLGCYTGQELNPPLVVGFFFPALYSFLSDPVFSMVLEMFLGRKDDEYLAT